MHFGYNRESRIRKPSGAETVLYAFCRRQNCTEGATPYASVISVNGRLYGTTYAGGAYGSGTVFMLEAEALNPY
jgi:uncharacterized repeat protein (TIGR03803 family)